MYGHKRWLSLPITSAKFHFIAVSFLVRGHLTKETRHLFHSENRNSDFKQIMGRA